MRPVGIPNLRQGCKELVTNSGLLATCSTDSQKARLLHRIPSKTNQGRLEWFRNARNFSNGAMRDKGGKELFDSICEAFGRNIEKHMSVYGAHNEERLTGLHETQAIDQFSYGVSDRGASIRVPASVPTDGWVGRLEDRRPLPMVTHTRLVLSSLRRRSRFVEFIFGSLVANSIDAKRYRNDERKRQYVRYDHGNGIDNDSINEP